MSRYSKRDFQLGDYWLSKQARSDAWCRTWFDHKTRQTRRASLGTTDFGKAKEKLTDWFVLNHKNQNEKPDDIPLSIIFAQYFESHGSQLKSAGMVRLALRYWLDFYEEKTLKEASDITLQEEFHEFLIDGKGLSRNSANRIVSIGKGAFNWAWKRGQLEACPYFLSVKLITPPPPKGRPLEVEEVAKLLEMSTQHHLRVFIAMMIATTARPDAVLDLTFDRCDLERRIIQLNPTDRPQTKKYRPVVRMPVSIVPYMSDVKEVAHEYVVSPDGAKVRSVRTTWRTTRARAGLDNRVNAYSLRHTMARWLRSKSVPAWEVAAQLGHKTQDLRTTEIYAPFDPNYLSQSVQAIDDFLFAVACELRVNSISELLKENL